MTRKGSDGMRFWFWVAILLIIFGGAAIVEAASESFTTFVDRHVTWYGQSELKITSESGEVLYIDPLRLPQRPQAADLILVTHEHGDHYNESVIQSLSKSGTTVIVPETMAKPGRRGLAIGQTVRIGAFQVTALPAYNTNKAFHPREKRWVGYLVEVDGVKLYHAGDTDFIPEMKGLGPDIAFLPVGGTYTMTAEEAAEAAAALQAKLVIPIHYGTIVGKKEDGPRFAGLVKGEAKVLSITE
jgi:L-ascorbate metabolism protein UlaG (beta-lactamase superfamily)